MTQSDLSNEPTMRSTRRRILQASAGLPAAALLHGRASAQDATPEASPVASPVAETPEAPPVVVTFPRPGTRTANPGTQIVYRGISLDDIGPVAVSGSESGVHAGVWIPHADGLGASYRRDRPFIPGETVSVRTRMDNLRDAEDGDYEFTVCVPRVERLEPTPNDPEVEGSVHEFRSRPGLRPQIISTDGVGEGTADGLIFTAPKNGAGRDGAMIVDQDGELVWFLPVDFAENRIYEFRAQSYRGEPVLTFWQGVSAGGHGFGHYVILNNRYETVTEFQAGGEYLGGDPHEFLITPNDTALILIYNVIEWDVTGIGGGESSYVVDNIVQELDIETGAVLFEWHCLDDIPLDWTQSEIEEDDEDVDYFHVNSAGIAPDGSIVISGRNTWSCHALDRETGILRWTLGGKGTTFALGEGVQTAWQHDFRAHSATEFTIFDNGAAPEVHEVARGLRVVLDFDEMTAELEQEYVHPDDLLSRSQGNMQVLPNGNVFIGWGNLPVASEFSADGELLQDWTLPEGKESFRSYKFPWVGMPSDPPALSVQPDGDDVLTAFVSWNGDTRSTSWRLAAGATSDGLETRATVERTGFETAIPVSANDLFFRVEALDAAGTVLGESRVIATVE